MEDTALIIGFTGTRNGMTEAQKAGIFKLLDNLNPDQVRHGDCVGADEQFHEIARVKNIPVFIHPPNNNSLRAYCMATVANAPPAPYHVRNKAIVDAAHVLIAAPAEASEQEKGGTWQTVKFARAKKMCNIYIVWPNGNIHGEGLNLVNKSIDFIENVS